MQITVLGCSGGIGKEESRMNGTTCLRINENILIDAGTGVGNLPLDELKKIDHIFLTHSHLDHCGQIPLIADAVGDQRSYPMTVHGMTETLKALKEHVFNNVIWPDFTRIPSQEQPYIRLEALAPNESFQLSGGTLRPVPARHSIPAIGYELNSGKSSTVFSGDTRHCEELIHTLSKMDSLEHLIIECSFLNQDNDLAQRSGHFCPTTLADFLSNISPHVMCWITHLKPGIGRQIMDQITQLLPGRVIKPLQEGQTLVF